MVYLSVVSVVCCCCLATVLLLVPWLQVLRLPTCMFFSMPQSENYYDHCYGFYCCCHDDTREKLPRHMDNMVHRRTDSTAHADACGGSWGSGGPGSGSAAKKLRPCPEEIFQTWWLPENDPQTPAARCLDTDRPNDRHSRKSSSVNRTISNPGNMEAYIS